MFNRPYDNQTQEKVAIETQAVLFIQKLILDKQIELVWSYASEYENDLNLNVAKQRTIANWRIRADIIVPPNDEILNIAQEIIQTGI